MLNGRRDLEGLDGVRVTVEAFRRIAEDAGFDVQTFQRDVELRLRMAGVRVFAAEDGETDGVPLLNLSVAPLHCEVGQRHAYGVTLKLIQIALLRRHLAGDLGKVISEEELDGLTGSVATWSRGAAGFGDLGDVHGVVKNLADYFANDYLAANPLTGSRLPASNPP